MARRLNLWGHMQPRAEHTGLSVGLQGGKGAAVGGDEGAVVSWWGCEGRQRGGESRVFPLDGHHAEAPHVRDMPMRRIPVIAAHLSMAAARKVMALRRIAVLLVEDAEHVVGTVDQRALDAADDEARVATAMKPLALHLQPRMSVAEAREMFVRARTNILPVIAGGFILGAVERAVIERTRPLPG